MPQWAHRLHYSTLNVWAPALASRLYYQHPHNVDMHAHQPKCAHISSWKENVPLLPHLTSPNLFFLLLYYYFFTPSRLFCYAKRQRYGKCFSCWKQKTGWRMKNQVVMNLKKKKKKNRCWCAEFLRGEHKRKRRCLSPIAATMCQLSLWYTVHSSSVLVSICSLNRSNSIFQQFFFSFFGGVGIAITSPLVIGIKNSWPLKIKLQVLSVTFGRWGFSWLNYAPFLGSKHIYRANACWHMGLVEQLNDTMTFYCEVYIYLFFLIGC